MSLPSKVVSISNHDYRIKKMPAASGHLFLMRIEARLSNAVGLLASNPLLALTKLLDTDGDDDALNELLSDFLEHVTFNGFPINHEEQFAGDYHGLIALLGEVIGYNFGFIRKRKGYTGTKSMGQETGKTGMSTPAQKKIDNIFKEFSQSPMVLAVLRSDMKVASYKDLCSTMTVEDLFNMYELVTAANDITAIQMEEARAQQAKANSQ
ncbi:MULTISPECIES: phage tail assembly chaperone [unclassified Pseudomonas]|uniref:phage tail assembly chaperone n=1 Tax=unclassified Pseudomonas TaxID=196821 RepID=UPI002248A24F|nr:hypothetical protein [Pseudomonas sp. DCB_BG]MCX2708355.1 hypothetical protein [Pseudomonas sp. DCB_BG]